MLAYLEGHKDFITPTYKFSYRSAVREKILLDASAAGRAVRSQLPRVLARIPLLPHMEPADRKTALRAINKALERVSCMEKLELDKALRIVDLNGGGLLNLYHALQKSGIMPTEPEAAPQ